MKRWLWYLGVLALTGALGLMPFSGTDVAKLQPVEVIRVQMQDHTVTVQTDTGDAGRGATLKAAFQDLEDTTPGKIFLETADYLLVDGQSESLLLELCDYLRPSCAVCLETGNADLTLARDFLSSHQPAVRLQDIRAGKTHLPQLVAGKERMRLVP